MKKVKSQGYYLQILEIGWHREPREGQAPVPGHKWAEDRKPEGGTYYL